MRRRFLDRTGLTEPAFPLIPEPAWRRFGKGRHPAGLTYGDCFSYALAEETGHPILCVGDDFGQTDISVVSAGSA